MQIGKVRFGSIADVSRIEMAARSVSMFGAGASAFDKAAVQAALIDAAGRGRCATKRTLVSATGQTRGRDNQGHVAFWIS